MEHNGDFNAAARKLRDDGYGEDDFREVDLSEFLSHLPDPPETASEADSAAQPLCELFETVTDLDPPIIHGLLREGETMNVIAAPKFGKALAINTPMLTDSGWLTMGNLQPGMQVHTHDGSLTEIVAVSNVLYGRPCYHVQTKSGAWVIADENHQWLVCQRNHQEVVTTGQLAAGHRGRRWLLPVAGESSRRDAIESVTPVASVPVRCIQVAHPSGLYLAGHDFMVTHNSWLVMRLAISIASGLDWFGMQVEHGRVLHIDNELRLKTIVHRYRTVAEALNVPHHLFSRNLDVKSLRGQLKDLNQLGEFFKKLEPNRYKAVVIDAFYRTLPVGTDENDNGAIANLYNKLDWYASRLKCAFILIHHSSKGNQAFKSVTDVGAGAGAQSRAADTHLILRAHDVPNVAVVEAAVRSWPPREPMCIRWEFPLWQPAQECDPYQLHGKVAESPVSKQEWTVERFIAECVIPFDPCSQNKIIYEAGQLGLTERKARTMIELGLTEGTLAKEKDGAHTHFIAIRAGVASGKAQLIAARLANDPAASPSELASEYGVSERYIREIRAALDDPISGTK